MLFWNYKRAPVAIKRNECCWQRTTDECEREKKNHRIQYFWTIWLEAKKRYLSIGMGSKAEFRKQKWMEKTNIRLNEYFVLTSIGSIGSLDYTHFIVYKWLFSHANALFPPVFLRHWLAARAAKRPQQNVGHVSYFSRIYSFHSWAFRNWFQWLCDMRLSVYQYILESEKGRKRVRESNWMSASCCVE